MARDYERLRKQDAEDIRSMAYTNTGPLHYSTKTPPCANPLDCLLCMESARLAVQFLRPILEKRVVESLMETYGVRCKLPHPGGD